jgi:phosphopantetheinyl transferase
MRASLLYVYTAAIPTDVGVEAVFPSSRSEEIFACGSEKTKKEKFCAWKLLEYALFHAFGKRIEEIAFAKSAQGKWTCDFCHFSLSHSENAVAVALSDSPIGIDIEQIKPVKNREKVAKKILTEKELEEYQRLPLQSQAANEFLLKIWTKKESIFKRGGFASFLPSRISANEDTTTKKVVIAGEEYFLSVTQKEGLVVDLHENTPYLP